MGLSWGCSSQALPASAVAPPLPPAYLQVLVLYELSCDVALEQHCEPELWDAGHTIYAHHKHVVLSNVSTSTTSYMKQTSESRVKQLRQPCAAEVGSMSRAPLRNQQPQHTFSGWLALLSRHSLGTRDHLCTLRIEGSCEGEPHGRTWAELVSMRRASALEHCSCQLPVGCCPVYAGSYQQCGALRGRCGGEPICLFDRLTHHTASRTWLQALHAP